MLSQRRRQWANIRLAFLWKIMNIKYLDHPPYPNRLMITLIQQGLGLRPREQRTLLSGRWRRCDYNITFTPPIVS